MYLSAHCKCQTCQPPKGKKKCETLNLELGKVVRNGQNVVRILESHISLKSCSSKHLDQFYNLGFVICMFCWWPSWNKRKNLVCTFGGSGKSQCSCKIKKLVQMLWYIVIALCFTIGHIHMWCFPFKAMYVLGFEGFSIWFLISE